MHVLVEGAVEGVIAQLVAGILFQKGENPVADLPHVVEGRLPRGKRQIPAPVMSDFHGVVELILAVDDGRLTAGVAQGPPRLEPGVVAHLPESRIHHGKLRPHQLFIGQVTDEVEGALARVLHPLDELGI